MNTNQSHSCSTHTHTHTHTAHTHMRAHATHTLMHLHSHTHTHTHCMTNISPGHSFLSLAQILQRGTRVPLPLLAVVHGHWHGLCGVIAQAGDGEVPRVLRCECVLVRGQTRLLYILYLKPARERETETMGCKERLQGERQKQWDVRRDSRERDKNNGM